MSNQEVQGEPQALHPPDPDSPSFRLANYQDLNFSKPQFPDDDTDRPYERKYRDIEFTWMGDLESVREIPNNPLTTPLSPPFNLLSISMWAIRDF